mgnify:CR=1 FL=1
MLFRSAATNPGARLIVGLRRGVTRERFTAAAAAGSLEECVHSFNVAAGDSILVRSGQVHAIDAGNLILEIQQNSDTTYRVFDWNRMGLDGVPRELHVEQSLASIDFADVEPPLAPATFMRDGSISVRPIVRHPLFDVDVIRVEARVSAQLGQPRLRVIAGVDGTLTVHGAGESVAIGAGEFCVLPASVDDPAIEAEAGSSYLLVTAG